ncbi:peptide-methionine (S)-S-oxide reductase MsrA [Parabacteroides distasonis]|uniref:peptide-methionine (S)-S-oxide reductase n=1 Tax=Parabacteroides distasonis TaxID=823 RepID=A0A3L7ZT89_PARDI|nr:peptide-methionine (S)-S-oxide reductase MsrA [Parabacteroides distasonis]NBH89270.1 peptide-methionine (S)-S-oxide reductase [Parabacteroides distasonis]RLT74491.1 peptide-methionine (S)-S-oxide reductase [Parabacteroides distasonis]TGY57496.1 peptide-methionine (S)-S-oxide reductase [Parabacteroides distasonis]
MPCNHPDSNPKTIGKIRGKIDNPTYPEVKTGMTGHVETVKVVFDSSQTSYEDLLRLYFETHDFTQVGGQGSDIGTQYRSVIFYCDEQQKKMTEKYIGILTDKGYKVATALEPATTFWVGEDYHQHYYDKKGDTPYCHIYRKIF